MANCTRAICSQIGANSSRRNRLCSSSRSYTRYAAAFAQFLEDHIFGVRDFAEYLDQCGGLKRLQALRQRELLLHLGK